MSNNRLFILVGIPGCGKSTWAANFFRNGIIVSSDAIREELTGDATDQTRNTEVFNAFHQRISENLRTGHWPAGADVIADSTALDAFARLSLVNIARDAGADAHLVFFRNLAQAANRNERRDRVVPKDVMGRMVAKYERAIQDIEDESVAQFYQSVTEIRSLN
jgi:protein phosphatase